jgi:hypothetical protein
MSSYRAVCTLAASFVVPGLVPGIHVFLARSQGVDGRDKPGHDGERRHVPTERYGVIEIGEKSTNQLFGCTKPLIFGLKARGATSWAT